MKWRIIVNPNSGKALKVIAIFLLCFSGTLFLILIVLPVNSMAYSMSLFAGILLSCIGGNVLIRNLRGGDHARNFRYLLFIGLLIRLAVAVQPKSTTDIDNWERYAYPVINRINIYETGLVLYPPPLPWLLGGLKLLSQSSGIPFYFLIRSILIINDILILYLLVRILRYSGKKRDDELSTASLYYLNPLTILTTTYHPQFGSIVFACLLLGYIAVRYKKNDYLGSLWLAVGTSIKLITIPALISFFYHYKKKSFRLSMPLITVSLLLLLVTPYYLNNPESVRNTLLNYTGRSGYFGFWSAIADFKPEIFASLMEAKKLLVLLTFAGCALAVIFSRRKGMSLIEATQISFLTFHLLTPGWAIQYLLWLLPFGVLCKRTHFQLVLFSLISSFAYTEYIYGNWFVSPQIFLPTLYITIFWWLLTMLMPGNTGAR